MNNWQVIFHSSKQLYTIIWWVKYNYIVTSSSFDLCFFTSSIFPKGPIFLESSVLQLKETGLVRPSLSTLTELDNFIFSQSNLWGIARSILLRSTNVKIWYQLNQMDKFLWHNSLSKGQGWNKPMKSMALFIFFCFSSSYNIIVQITYFFLLQRWTKAGEFSTRRT